MSAMECIQEVGFVIIDDNPDHRALLERTIDSAFASDQRRPICFSHEQADVALADLPTTDHNIPSSSSRPPSLAAADA